MNTSNRAAQAEYSWQYIYRIAQQHKKQLINGHFVAILATVASVPVPLLMPLLVDEVLLNHPGVVLRSLNPWLPGEWQQPVVYIAIILLASLVLRLFALVLNIIQTRQFSNIAKDVIFRIRESLVKHLQHISMSEYESLGSGTVSSHMVTDLDTLDNFIGTTISKLLVAVLTVFGTALILLWMHWQLGLFIIFLNPLVIYLARAVGSRVKELKANENKAYAIFQQALSETLEAIHQIRASNREEHYCRQLIGSALAVKNHSTIYAWKSDATVRLSFLTFLFGFDIFRATAMLMVLYSNLSIGEMLAVFGYLWFMMAPVQEILSIQQSFYAAKAALARVNQLTLLQREPYYPHLQNPFSGHKTVSVSVKNLHFSYKDEPVLNGINLTIPAGEKIALVGASGGGKSTLAQTLIGLYPPGRGMIYFDDVPLDRIGLDVVREHVATVLQHPALLNDTIRANLTLGREIADAELWHALEIAQMRLTVEEQPQGLDTVVGRQGMRLSGGQRQRLAIARMIVSHPAVVILDEATSALDSETEFKLHQALNTFLEGRTTIIIAHRLSAVKQADHVYVFEQGQICEQGKHDTLIQQNGLYAKLYGDYQ
ncbi:Efflux ABC transporter, permease/ATP-binding protein [Methylomonas albis]|uniref:ABC transporter ATP-binding protein n=1 Tax=Methylomonas albis TaxID=1854563 RepID=A0ABR9CYK8_9GAMM|nr:ABC transporter ATP-binding protein [Methylomonas albis]MBD9355952.1 ABC transporter ATP-binding protein [Methylomonas albis]CAD6878988.1 Efflux ABC transporter, permease/ATP-binding protein [Methylomonas albis]